MNNLWKRKLAAYLHDPPEKAYDFGEHHKERARVHAESFGVAELWQHLTGNPDWSAAAADRFVFPSGQKLEENLGEALRPCFIHPLSGRREAEAASLPTHPLTFPKQADAEAWLSEIRPEWKSDDPQTLFLRAWRLWSDHAAAHATGQGQGAELLPYLPADTRIADGSIWHHCAIVSALEATRETEDPRAPLRPAFLLFQIGPVQDFIAQARSTRDLWSGSYLLSWLTMHALKAVADGCGPDAIIFPSLKGQPLYDFLERRLDVHPDDDSVLVPGVPNRFLALVPAGFDVEHTVGQAFRDEWQRIAGECQSWLSARNISFDAQSRALWDQQVRDQWHLTWQLWPWQDAEKAITAFQALPLGAENPLHLAKTVAEAIRDAHKDERCYRGGQLDPGWAWSAHYQLCQHALDARRSLRDFRGLPTDSGRKPGHRDALSGREEAVVQADMLEHVTSPDLRALFRHAEPLGAANLIKRVWHKAYLARLNEIPGKKHLPALRRARGSFDSVPAVAAGAFAQRLYENTASEGPLRAQWLAFTRAASEVREDFPESIAPFSGTNELRWLEWTDQSVFFPEVWQREQRCHKQGTGEAFFHSAEARQRLAKAETALRALLAEAQRSPASYYAILALDGDQIGKWLSGEKSPDVAKVISPKAAAYFREHVQGVDIEKWLASPRAISPSWHLQFSEALAHFGLFAARRIVEQVHHGQLIYSGGDDVLAMLPADEAIACAVDLRAAFQGRQADMSSECRRLFREDAPEGFLWLGPEQVRPGEPTWPLLVPGPRMTVSVGLALGHVKEPLQDMIQEAQKAEKWAKAPPERLVFHRAGPDPAGNGETWKPSDGWNRDALAVTLFKRSGETLRWGARFGSAAFDLLATLRQYFRTPWEAPKQSMPITGRFPYQLAALLGAYEIDEPLSPELRDIALREFDHVVSRQAKDLPDKTAFRQQAERYLDELVKFSWARPANPGLPPCPHVAARSLRPFINLFLLEAFIRRQAD